MNTFTYKYNPPRDFGSNREFYNNLKEALDSDEANEAKPSLLRLLAITQVVMNSWAKDAYTAKRKGPVAPTNTDNALTLLGTPSTSKHQWVSTVRDADSHHNHERDECKQRDVPGWNDQGV